MKKIQILGLWCPECKKLTENVEQAVKELGLDYEIEKVMNMEYLIGFTILMAPALFIDGKMESASKVLSVDEVKKML